PTLIVYVLFYFYARTFIPVINYFQAREKLSKFVVLKLFELSLFLGVSPILAHISATIEGLSTVKALNVQNFLQLDFDNYQNHRSSLYYLLICVRFGFGFWADFVCALYSAFIVVSLLLL